MRVLLDENLPHRLRLALSAHDVRTVAYMGWAGIQNGQLLALVESAGFAVFITADRKLEQQQNFTGRQIAIIFLTAQEWHLILPHVQEIAAAIERAKPGTHQTVECGRFQRTQQNRTNR